MTAPSENASSIPQPSLDLASKRPAFRERGIALLVDRAPNRSRLNRVTFVSTPSITFDGSIPSWRNVTVGERGLYFVAVGDTGDKPSVDFFDFATGKRSTLVRLDKPFWFGMTLSPDERSLVFPLVDSAGSNVMVVDRFQ